MRQMKSIRKSIVIAIAGAAMALGATAAFALEDIVESARVGCKTEIDTLCKDVTPGEGRVSAVPLRAPGQAFEPLRVCVGRWFAAAGSTGPRDQVRLRRVQDRCGQALRRHQVGDGRIAECLKKNQATLDPKCTQAMKDTQMQVK
jgi:hypothetical protein